MKSTRPTRLRPAILATSVSALLALCSTIPSARAAVDNWTGGTNASWDTTTNWSLAGKPTGADSANFPAVIPGTGSTITLTAGEVANSLTFLNSYTLTGGSLALTTGTVNVSPTFNATINTTLTGGGPLIKTGTGTLNLAGANSYTGITTIADGTLVMSTGTSSLGAVTIGNTTSGSITPVLSITSGTESFSQRIGLGGATGARGVLNISGTANVAANGDFIMFGGDGGVTNFNSSGVINQSGGTFTVNSFNVSFGAGILLGWSLNAYGAYVLSGGTLNYNPGAGIGEFTIANQNNTAGLFSQSGGTANIDDAFAIGRSTTVAGVVDVSGGTMTHTSATNFMNTGYGGAATGVLTVRGTGTVQEQSGNFFVTGGNNASTGIVNLLTGGTLEVNRIQKTASASAKATINFDGGTLKVFSTNAGANFFSGLDHAFVYGNGVTIDSNGQNVTIGQALTAPGGFGIGASGSTIAVASGGTGYIAPPVVTFAAPASGVAATGVAVIDGNGKATGVIITSPGSGYTSGQNVALAFNGGSNTNNAATTTATGFNTTASTLNTSGGLTKIGAGTLTLSGSNTYTGGTTITGGILQLGDGATLLASLGSGPVTVTNGTFVLNLTNDEIFANSVVNNSHVILDDNVNQNYQVSGGISGSGDVLKTGANTVTYIGSTANTFNGRTTVDQGVLVLNKTAGVDAITRGGLLVTNGADVQVLADEQVNNAAAVTVNNGGRFRLLGHTETIGSLFGNGGVSLSTGAAGGTLLVGAGNFSGVISDSFVNDLPGNVVKYGPGTLILSGHNTYAGNTTVNGGQLIVNGSLASPNVIVNALGLLGGNGVFVGSVTNRGTVSPGNSPGTLTVKGNYTQAPTGTLVIEVAGKNTGQHDVLAVGGQAKLEGGLRLVRFGSPKLKVGDKVKFLTAGGGVQGQFATVSNNVTEGTLLKTKVLYQADAVQFAVTGTDFSKLAGLTSNQRHTAAMLDAIGSDSRAAKLLDYLAYRRFGEVPSDLDRLAPEELASAFNIGVSQGNVQAANLERRMDDLRAGSAGFSASGLAVSGSGPSSSDTLYLNGPTGKTGKELRPPADDRWGVFITGVGEFTGIGDTSNSRGYDLTTGGITLGADYRVTPNFAAGLHAGYASTGADLANGGRLTADAAKLGLYATYFTGGFHADAAVSGGLSGYNTRRSAIQGSARGSTDGGELNVLAATGYDWKVGALTVGPTLAFQYTYMNMNGFTEHGSLAPLRLATNHGESLRTDVGAKASYDWHVGGAIVRPEVRAAWQHEYGDSTYGITSRLSSGAGADFLVTGPEIGRDSLLLGAGVAVLWNERTSTYVYYDGEVFRSNYSSNIVSGGVRLNF